MLEGSASELQILDMLEERVARVGVWRIWRMRGDVHDSWSPSEMPGPAFASVSEYRIKRTGSPATHGPTDDHSCRKSCIRRRAFQQILATWICHCWQQCRPLLPVHRLEINGVCESAKVGDWRTCQSLNCDLPSEVNVVPKLRKS